MCKPTGMCRHCLNSDSNKQNLKKLRQSDNCELTGYLMVSIELWFIIFFKCDGSMVVSF